MTSTAAAATWETCGTHLYVWVSEEGTRRIDWLVELRPAEIRDPFGQRVAASGSERLVGREAPVMHARMPAGVILSICVHCAGVRGYQ